ncbi:zinc-binding dehydrogenase [Paracoccus pantotrophus]|uniref:Zinc-binding dehydrogenase n=1 Tax=Paracoccus pantotrophus TaxID=82367 RepID=A0A7H9BQI9_PARPN|nr:zinc-binding dehydrogenase [Paracoccus pantotrophus]QLH12988.1 zinc-binding dehydrogenase [Paracoccus pantotrophus]
MRGVVFTGNRQLEIMRFDDPTPGPGQAVLRMKASGMCGSDLHYYRAENMMRHLAGTGLITLGKDGFTEDTRIIAGHEPCGVIEAVGPGVDPKRFKAGDRVIVYHYEGCGFCDHCRTGWNQMCDEGSRPHGAVLHGGHADYMRVPVSTLVRLPDEISFVAGAAIACGTGTAYGACVRLDLSARDTLAVFGLGPVGLSAVQLAAAMGVEVIGVDIDPGRIETARKFGAAHVVNGKEKDPVEEIRKLTRGLGASCAMDCAGGVVPKQQAVRSTAPWGRIAMVAVNGDIELSVWNDMIAKQRTVLGSWTFSINGMKDCARFIADHGVDVDAIFSDRWILDQAETAYNEFDKQTGGKGVFVFD